MSPLDRARNGMLLAITQIERDVRLRDLTDDEMKDLARAVLEAIREPFQSFDDPAAIAGGEVLGIGQDRPVHWSNYNEARRVWQAMIDAALAE